MSRKLFAFPCSLLTQRHNHHKRTYLNFTNKLKRFSIDETHHKGYSNHLKDGDDDSNKRKLPKMLLSSSYLLSSSLETVQSPAPPNTPAIEFSFWKLALVFVGVPFCVYLYKCAVLILFQNKLIYMPYFPPGSRSELLNVSTIDKRLICKQIEILTKDRCKLSGVFIRNKPLNYEDHGNTSPYGVRDTDPILIYFQGNAGNVIVRLPIFMLTLLSARNGQLSNLTIIAPSYRGYWQSTGRPSERGLQSDAIAVYEYIHQNFPTNPLYLYGHSLGGSVAIYLAKQIQDYNNNHQLRGIILENVFTSIKDMIVTIYPQKWLPYRYLINFPFLIRNKWDNVTMIREINVPILFLSSRNDEIVPQKQMRQLYLVAEKTPKKIWKEFRNGLHQDTFLQNGYSEGIIEFIRNTLEKI
ncbi:13225_t:CDS:2 [Ambispora gerdemannii]|uniref:13225_t:CDS:1 n=1 Tax=Ambispora gerdemannii TaxID=144530 RepID=A0A9N8ZIF9_9GLOM|nr:13225_t:CDS:2 [Ambispora gerdemannii]